ncbi:MAG: 50S ribosomal protein L10 [Chloroflexota bacterium]
MLAISRARKEELVATYNETLAEADGLLIAKYNAMTVAETEQLRHKLRENQGEFMVTKNTLLKIALDQSGWPVPEDMLAGPVGVCFSKGNMPGMTKAVMEFAKNFENKFVLKGGVMGTDVFGEGDIKAVSELPTLDELYPQILGMLVQPQQGLVNTLQAANGSVVNVLQPGVAQILNVLQAHITQNLEGGEGAATDAA